ncbi:MAG: cation:proton antiporter [Rhodocyclaceae bacterium]|nr:MAG: cation:proton antiporter [Rhodocyclaceae bacterium]
MIQAPDLPLWAAITVALLLLAGATTALLGSIGLLRLKTFYERVHAPTLATSFGTLLICLASIVCFSVLRSRPSVHEILIVIFITLTAPVSFMLLGRAALYRDRTEGNPDVPSQPH